MEETINAPATSSGRFLKSDTERSRSMSDDRIKFINEEYDFLCHEIAAWLSQLAGKEIDEDLIASLNDGVELCNLVKNRLPSVKIEKFHENTEKNAFYAKDNIAVFSRACQEMGINKNDTLDCSMFEHNDRKQVVNCLLRFAVTGIKYGLKPISLIHSERLETFIKAMPEDVVSEIRNIIEAEKEEPKKEETKEEKKEENEWSM